MPRAMSSSLTVKPPVACLRERMTAWTPPVLIVLGLAVLFVVRARTNFAFNDYDREASEAFWALRTGDFSRFLSLVNAYGGSMVLRTPLALLPGLWGGGEIAVWRAVSLPGVAGCAALAAYVAVRMDKDGRPWLDRVVVLLALLASPIALRAWDVGHPEELVGAVLCVAAVLVAPGRPVLGGVLLGLAVANKPWAVVAGPVVLALVPPGARVRTVLTAGAVALLVVAPLLLLGGMFVASAKGMATTDAVWQPWQLWYLLGDAVPSVRSGRSAADWVLPITRPLIIGSSLAVALGWWARHRARGVRPVDGLLALALCLHLRCLLDPWNYDYYAFPAFAALATWEGLSHPRRVPLATAVFAAAHYTTFEALRLRVDDDVSSLVYLGWALPMAVWMLVRLLARDRTAHS